MKYSQWVTYKGKTFLFVSVAYRTETEYIEALKEYQAAWLEHPDLPVLMDFTGAKPTLTALQLAQQIHQQNSEFRKENHVPVKPVAIIGAGEMVRSVFDFGQSQEMIFFAANIESAKNWLECNS